MFENLSSTQLILCIIFLVFSIGVITFVSTEVFAQDEEYYQDVEDNSNISEYEDNSDIPEYNDPGSYQDFPDNEDQNPYPEFMEEVEPGEYDQSDDVTELNENNY